MFEWAFHAKKDCVIVKPRFGEFILAIEGHGLGRLLIG